MPGHPQPRNNDGTFSSLTAPSFSGSGDQPMFIAGLANRQDGLIYTANQKTTRERGSLRRWIFVTPTGRHAEMNAILWQDAMQTKPLRARC